ncbi:hypothetical protein C0992_008196 [Termitomyces sp. T32_za158]|nr:hypothetical protein C0992_008196 [Termitomyces sp. T32_za158]
MPSSSKNRPEQAESPQKCTLWDEFLVALKVGVGKEAQQGKELTGPLAAFYQAGKLIPRLINLFLELNAVFIHGLVAEGLLDCSFIGGEDDEGSNEDEEDGDSEDEEDNTEKSRRIHMKKLHLAAFKKIIALEPQILKYTKKLCRNMDEDTDYYASSLKDFVDVVRFQKGSMSARTADTRKVKDSIITIMQNSSVRYLLPSITTPLPNKKADRGFNSFDTGLLICPAQLAWRYNDSFRLLLRDGKVDVTAHDFPIFMYDKTQCFQMSCTEFPEGHQFENELDAQYFSIMDGLCRGPLLIAVCRHMLFGSGIDRAEKYAMKRPIAAKYGIARITPEIIAQAAVQVRE